MKYTTDIKLPYGGKSHIQIDYAREVYAAFKASGDSPKNDITLEELDGFTYNGETFERWLKVNNMTTFEEVIR